MNVQKLCPRCKQVKGDADFYVRREGYLSGWCRQCTRDAARKPNWALVNCINCGVAAQGPAKQWRCSACGKPRFVLACPGCTLTGNSPAGVHYTGCEHGDLPHTRLSIDTRNMPEFPVWACILMQVCTIESGVSHAAGTWSVARVDLFYTAEAAVRLQPFNVALGPGDTCRFRWLRNTEQFEMHKIHRPFRSLAVQTPLGETAARQLASMVHSS
jgi:hypothetical protein